MLGLPPAIPRVELPELHPWNLRSGRVRSSRSSGSGVPGTRVRGASVASQRRSSAILKHKRAAVGQDFQCRRWVETCTVTIPSLSPKSLRSRYTRDSMRDMGDVDASEASHAAGSAIGGAPAAQERGTKDQGNR